MIYYGVQVSEEYGWIMYFGREPMFNWLREFLDRRLPGMGEHVIRRTDGEMLIDLPELPQPKYREALELLAFEAAQAAQAALEGPLSGVYPVTDYGGDSSVLAAVGDVKTIALIASNVLRKTA